MARRHWLDPLARKVLQAMGDLPPDPVQPLRTASSSVQEQTPAPSLRVVVKE